jgi:intracellular sulfur oxidation DsrE/DsrF family protein
MDPVTFLRLAFPSLAAGPFALLLPMVLALASPLAAQTPQGPFGPVIRGHGPVFDTPNPEFQTPLDLTYRLAFDLAEGSTSADDVNRGLVSVARFLNMHAGAGVPLEQLQVAVVIHGTAAKDFLDAEAFRAETGFDNPNLGLIQELADNGVRFIMCGQSLGSRGLPRSGLVAPVETALSAMTAHLVLQARGYRINPF